MDNLLMLLISLVLAIVLFAISWGFDFAHPIDSMRRFKEEFQDMWERPWGP